MKREITDQIVLCTSDTLPTEDIGLTELDRRDRRKGYFQCVYHFVIRRSGLIEHGHRHHKEHAMHLGRHNPWSITVCLVGGKGEPVFTKGQLGSLRALLNELRDEYPDAVLRHHSDIDKKIPFHGVDLGVDITSKEQNNDDADGR